MSTTARLSAIYGSAGVPARPLSREEALAGQRGRLLAGIAAAVAEKGYAETTLADIVKRAGTSRRTFYEHFRDKEDCFIAAYDRAVEYILSQMAAAMPATEDWNDLCRVAVREYLAILSVEPEFRRAFIVEVTRAGEAAWERRAAVHRQFADFIAAIHAVAAQQDDRVIALPHEVFEGLVGAINEWVASFVRTGRGHELTQLEDVAVLLLAGVFLGAGEVPGVKVARRHGDADQHHLRALE